MSRVKALVEQLEGARSLPTGRISPNSGGYIEIIVDDDEEDDFDDSKNYLVNLPLVVQDIILGYLSVRELLTLRRVCRGTLDWVQRKPWNPKKFEMWQCYSPKLSAINPYGLKYAVSMKAPISRFQLIINHKESKEMVYKFLAMYGPTLKSLTFRRGDDKEDLGLSVKGSGNSCACRRKRQCFKCSDKVSILDVLFLDDIRFPFVFQKLSELKLDFVVKNRKEARVVIKMLEMCSSLKSLKLPIFDLEDESPDFAEMPYMVVEEFLNPVILYVQRRGRYNLEVIDMEAWKDSDIFDHGLICNRIVELITEASVFNVRFVNLQADLIQKNVFSRQDWQFMIEEDHADIRPYQMVQSLVNPGPKLLSFLKFPHLQELSIGCSDYQSYTVPHNIMSRVQWPNLKSINIDTRPSDIASGISSFRMGGNVVLAVPDEARKIAWAKTMNMIGGFSGLVSRSSVERLSINEKSARYFEERYHTCGLEFPPTTLATSFTDLTVLNIERWDSAGDEGFLLVWRALRKLTNLKIKHCFRLTDYGFIGKRELAPAFHKLKCLKKLEIVLSTNSSQMSDRTLRLVLSHMPLTDFRLEGCLHSYGKGAGRITENGILALADGVFGKSIQVFHLDVDASPWLTPRRCGELSRLFRSTI